MCIFPAYQSEHPTERVTSCLMQAVSKISDIIFYRGKKTVLAALRTRDGRGEAGGESQGPLLGS